jgi:hypothetical protein
MQNLVTSVKLGLAGLLITPVVWVCGVVGAVLSLPVFVQRLPWKLLRRPVMFVLLFVVQFVRALMFWAGTLGYSLVFLADSVSADTHPRDWQLPYWLRVRYRLLLTAQRFLGMLKFQTWERHLRDEALAWCRAHPPTPQQVHREIPRVDASQITPQEFYNRYIRNPHPVILSGLNANSHAVRHWNPEYFRKYEDERAPLFTGDAEDAYQKTRFGDFLDYIRDNIDVPVDQRPPKYVANFANLCNNHPELIDELNVRQMSSWLPGARQSKLAGVHIFIGLEGTSTVFHCANTPNWFFQVQGQKRWTFVHPEHLMMMYPVVTSDVFYGGSMLPYPEPDPSIMEQDFPLWAYCPRYETVLEPGDVLFNPSWWWHRIMNESSPTIGCATRWIILPMTRTNRLFDFYHFYSSYFFCNFLTLMGKLTFRQPALTDETTLTLEQRKARIALMARLHAEKRPSRRQPATTPAEKKPVAAA